MVYETVTDLDQLMDRIKSYDADADLQASPQGLRVFCESA